MLSAYVEVLLCVIELLAFVAFKNTTISFLFFHTVVINVKVDVLKSIQILFDSFKHIL